MLLAGGGVRGGQVIGASDSTGSYPADRPTTPADVQDLLQQWLQRYVVNNDSASHEMKAKYPLREARVEMWAIAFRDSRTNALDYLERNGNP